MNVRHTWWGAVLLVAGLLTLGLAPAHGGSGASSSAPSSPVAQSAAPPNAVGSSDPSTTAYGNATFVLPGFTCYGQFQDKPGGAADCQTPILSWTQDGVFYVNSSSDLVFYSFANSTAYEIAAWTMLWQTFPTYHMIPNELFLTQDGSYIYSWGTLKPSSTIITVEAVNVTTGQRFEYNFNGVSTSSFEENGQMNLVGFDGNDSWVDLIDSNAQVLSYNLWTGVQAQAATLDYFEANNAYWIPYLNAYVNVEAGGSTADGVEEWQMYSPNGLLHKTFSDAWGSGCRVNGVNGMAYNVTSHVVYFSGGAGGAASCGPSGGNNLVWYHVDPSTGNLTGSATHLSIQKDVDWAVASDGYRNTLVSAGPLFAGGYFTTNDSFLFSPPDTFSPTNGSPWIRVNPAAEQTWETWYADGAFFNTSYFLPATAAACPGAYDDRVFGSACSVNSSSYPSGTIWYSWQLGQPEFPYPATSAIAQVGPPSSVEAAATALSSTSVELSWAVPPGYSMPIINWTLEYAVNGGPTLDQSLWGQNRSVVVTDLPPIAKVTYCVRATNLHGTGPCAKLDYTQALYAVTFSESGLPTGTDWAVTVGSTTVSSVTPTVILYLANGSYSYDLNAVPGYRANVSSGTITVTGAPVTVKVRFSVTKYTFTVAETGLASGTKWCVNLTPGPSECSTGSTVKFHEPNGTYSYLIAVVPGYRITAGAYIGEVTVDGMNPPTVRVHWSPVDYDVKFIESGLAHDAEWSVTIGSRTKSSDGSSISFDLANGSYPFSIVASGYSSTSSPTSPLVVDGAVVSVEVEFTEL